jgi:tyrosinase
MAKRIRKAIHNLADSEVADLRKAYGEIQALRDNRGYEQAAGYHGVPNFWCWHHPGQGAGDMRGRDNSGPLALFLPWHRAYALDFEMRLRDRVPTVTLPWWDWTKDRGVPPAFAAHRVDGKANPLYRAFIDQPRARPPVRHWTKRDPGRAQDLPTQAQINAVLDISDFLEFSAAVESIHDGVHGWVGGDMGVVPLAAFDPIFWVHHCMIDRIWRMWQTRHGARNIPESLLEEPLEPFRLTVRQVLNVSALHYEYAASEASVAFPRARG